MLQKFQTIKTKHVCTSTWILIVLPPFSVIFILCTKAHWHRARTFFFFFVSVAIVVTCLWVKSCVAVIVVFLNMKGLSTMNALALAGMAIRTRAFVVDSQDIEFGNPWWFVYAGISCFLVLFAGIMSGLTLGLMSLGLVELEILQRSGTSTEKKQAGLFI